MADAPKILPTDYLDEAYPKMNLGIENANEALRKYADSDIKINEAINSADVAKRVAVQALPGERTKNLFNKQTAKSNFYVQWNTGILRTPTNGLVYYASDDINVVSNEWYTIHRMNQTAFYNDQNEYVSGIDNSSNLKYTFQVPANATRMKITTLADYIDEQQVEIGKEATSYTPYLLQSEAVLSYIPLIGKKSKNFIDKSKVIKGKYVRFDSGTFGDNEAYSLMIFEANELENYVTNFGNQFAYYDINMKYLSGKNTNTTPNESTILNTPVETRYIAASIPNSKLDTAQIEVGTVSTEYEEGGVKLPTSYFDTKTKKALESIEKEINPYKSIISIVGSLIKDSHFKIKLIGDSITAGLGGTGYNTDGETIYGNFKVNTSGYCWANLLKNYLEAKFTGSVVKNWGTSGRNSYDLLQHIATLVESDDDLIICMIGTNDRNNESRDGILNSKEGLYNNLLAIAEYVRGLGKEIIFMSCIPASVRDETNNKLFHMEDVDTIIMSAAAHYNMEYISLYKKMLNYCEMKDVTIDSFLDDGLHPNDAGYLVMFNFVCDGLGIGRKRADATW